MLNFINPKSISLQQLIKCRKRTFSATCQWRSLNRQSSATRYPSLFLFICIFRTTGFPPRKNQRLDFRRPPAFGDVEADSGETSVAAAEAASSTAFSLVASNEKAFFQALAKKQ